ncbi:MAG: hypothetical protein K5987_05380 [Lachnospiraceae bacterium]|nr:hypothetical protein [Lachnospiraceae bacterium]
MDYNEKINGSLTLDELFAYWKEKDPGVITYASEEGKIEKTVDHKRDYFIADGIVNEDIWNSGNRKRILFVLKEAYGADWGTNTLATWLKNDHPSVAIWKRIAKWVNGIQNTNTDRVKRYEERLSDSKHAECLEQIAVMNLKKSGGVPQSNYSEIDAYADYDKMEIRKEFSLIDADIIICGATFRCLLEKVFEQKIIASSSGKDNWYYFLNLDGKERLYIDMYHPANRWPDLMNYYTVTNIYQQALIECNGRYK